MSTHTGGYVDGSGTPTDVLNYGLERTDAALQSMIDGLRSAGLYDSTLYIVTAKHGQSPINRANLNKPGHLPISWQRYRPQPIRRTLRRRLPLPRRTHVLPAPAVFAQDDDIALLWLADQSQAPAVAAYLNRHVTELFIDEVLAGSELKLKFNDPLHDNRTPDVIVQPNYGIVYTTSSKKDSEHGGFSFGDTNVGLIVANPSLSGRVLKTPVATSQVAATILQAVGINPKELDGVRVEGTEVLPGLSLH